MVSTTTVTMSMNRVLRARGDTASMRPFRGMSHSLGKHICKVRLPSPSVCRTCRHALASEIRSAGLLGRYSDLSSLYTHTNDCSTM